MRARLTGVPLAIALLAGCGARPPGEPATPPSPVASDGSPGVQEVQAATREEAIRRIEERCAGGYRIESEDDIDEGVAPGAAKGRGRSALPADPKSHVRVRYRCDADATRIGPGGHP